MKKYIGIAVSGLLAVAVGMVLAVQMSSTAGSDQGGLVPYSKLKDYEVALSEARNEKEDALEELTLLQERLQTIEREMSAEDAVIDGLLSETEKYRLITGAVDVHGPGIIITIKDPVVTDEYQDDISIITYHYEELLSLVNKLKEAGAEAISINDHRIVQTTEISLAGQNININGNPTTMENAISIRGGIVETLKKNYNLTVDISTYEDLVVPRYNGVITFRYANPVTESEEE